MRDDLVYIGQKDRECQELLFRLNEHHFSRLQLRSITIDIDGTSLPVDGHQRGAEKGYCPAEPGSPCFQSLSAICDETETIIAEETRFGNTHCSNGIVPFCQTILDRFSSQMDTISIRLDTSFYSDELLRLSESKRMSLTNQGSSRPNAWANNCFVDIAPPLVCFHTKIF